MALIYKTPRYSSVSPKLCLCHHPFLNEPGKTLRMGYCHPSCCSQPSATLVPASPVPCPAVVGVGAAAVPVPPHGQRDGKVFLLLLPMS